MENGEIRIKFEKIMSNLIRENCESKKELFFRVGRWLQSVHIVGTCNQLSRL